MDKSSKETSLILDETERKSSIINTDKINTTLQTAQIVIFLGVLLDGVFGLLLYNLTSASKATVLQIILFSGALLLGTVLIVWGFAKLWSVKKIGRYVSILRAGEEKSVTMLSQTLKKSETVIIKDLQNIFKQAYLFGSLDPLKNSVVLTNRMIQPIATQSDNPDAKTQETKGS